MTALQQTAPLPQKQKKSLRDIFNHFAAEAVERFPDLNGRLLILDINEGFTQEMKKNKNESSCAFYEPNQKVSIIFINDRLDEKELNDVSEKTEKEMLFTLDHELGHLAIKNAYDYGNFHEKIMAESIADAYALLRHYERFGADIEYMDLPYAPLERARNMFFYNDKAHFTTFVLDEIIKRKHLIDFDCPDHVKTDDLAWRFAMAYTPSEPVIAHLYASYEPLRKAYKAATKPEDWLKVLVDIVLNPEQDYYAFKAGSHWLMKYLETGTYLNGDPVNLPAEYLDDVLKKLKEREFKFAKEDILFNIPTAAAPQSLKKCGVPDVI